MARWAFLGVYGLSGAAALLYQVAWSRLLTLHMGHTVAAVGTVLAAFMGGLAAGAALGGKVAPRLDPRLALVWYARLELAIAGFALLIAPGLIALQPLLRWAYADGAAIPFGLVRTLSILFLIAAPALAMGATLPVAMRWFVGNPGRAGGQAGILYAINTLGAAVGAAATGFLLLPLFGLRTTTLVGVAMNAAAAAGAFRLAARQMPGPKGSGLLVNQDLPDPKEPGRAGSLQPFEQQRRGANQLAVGLVSASAAGNPAACRACVVQIDVLRTGRGQGGRSSAPLPRRRRDVPFPTPGTCGTRIRAAARWARCGGTAESES